MADSLRIRGQESQVRLTRNGVLERTMTAIESFDWIVNVDILQKGYLGETGDRLDEIYKSTSYTLKFDPESSDAFTLIQLVRDRAQRRTAQANAHINLVFVANFPNGQRPKITLPDVKIKDPGMGFTNRDAYVGATLSGMCESFILSGV